MNIETEITPNPETLKFLVDKQYILHTGIEIKNIKDAKKFKFSNEIFQIKGIKSLYIGENFIAITKHQNLGWSAVKTKILTFLLDYISENEFFIEKKADSQKFKKKKKNKISQDIEKIIDEKVRPAVARDGGDIIFKDFEKGTVSLVLKGACAGCPSSTATLKQGIENLLKHYFPEVKEVRAVE